MSIRVIPCLLLKNLGLIKTFKFKNEIYIGDPINAIRIFNDKEVDELVFLDISASKENRKPNISFIRNLASECFMPFAYGGGITTLDEIAELNSIGVEKVIINSSAFIDETFIPKAIDRFGSSSIVLSLDFKKDIFGNYSAYILSGSKKINLTFMELLNRVNQWQVGEVIVNCIERDGVMNGYDEVLIKKITNELDMPLVALGGAGSLEHMKSAVINAGASAVAAGSFFVFYGPHKAVLINYPNIEQLNVLNS
jgi:cyclase